MSRRRFIVNAGAAVTTATVGAAAALQAPAVIAQQKYRWRMPTTWTPALDIMQGSAQRFATMVGELSGGRLTIEASPAGQIVPPLGVFDACSKGTVEAFMGASYYWAAKEPAVQWFCAVPFGMNPSGMQSWLHHADGLKLWEETYAAFNLVPRPGVSTGPQMGGWFRRKINSLADFKGLKMRIPGLGGQVVARAGATVVLTPAGEIYGALERGVIDASEWVGPHDDMKLGLPKTAQYYYYPGWHEPGTTLEFTFNRKAYEALPVDLRHVLDYAVSAVALYGTTEYEARNALALERLRNDYRGKIEILQLPTAVLKDLKKSAAEVVRAEADKSPMAKKVYASFSRFQAQIARWHEISESAFHQHVAS
jgi:TRAP-type mannitol/chloroaromatic compound transport system substrate-binding protein